MTDEEIKQATPKHPQIEITSKLAPPLLEVVRQLPADLGKLVLAASVGMPLTGRIAKKADRSRYPYYKKKYGEGIRPAIDKMLADNKYEPLFTYSSMKDMRRQTLMSCIRQAFDWVVEQETDEDRKRDYERLRGDTIIRSCARGVFIARLHEPALSEAPCVTSEDKMEADGGYMERLHTFIEHAEEGAKMNIENCVLADSEYEAVDKLLGQLPTFRWSYNRGDRKLTVLRLTEEQMNTLRDINV